MYSKYYYLGINSSTVQGFSYGSLGDVHIPFLYVTFMLLRAPSVVNAKMWVIARRQLKACILESERRLRSHLAKTQNEGK